MQAISTKGLDQSEATTLVEQLKLHAANLGGILSKKNGFKTQLPALSGDCIEDLNLLTAHVSDLERRIGASAPTFLARPGRVDLTFLYRSCREHLYRDALGTVRK